MRWYLLVLLLVYVGLSTAISCEFGNPNGSNGNGNGRTLRGTVINPPEGNLSDEDSLFEATFFAWKFGGTALCIPPSGAVNGAGGFGGSVGAGGAGGSNGGFGGVGGNGDPTPVVITIMDGPDDPCDEDLDEGDRLLFLEVSDLTPGTYRLGNDCVDFRRADGSFAVFRGQALILTRALEGQVTLLGLDDDNALEGTFSIRFQGETGFTSGGFLVPPACF